MMKFFRLNSIFKKTFYTLVVTILVFILLFTYSLVLNQKESLLSDLYSKGTTIASTIKLSNSDAIIDNDYPILVERIQKLLDNNVEIKYIILFNKTQKPVLSENKTWRLLSDVPEVIKAMNGTKENGDIIQSSLLEENVYHISYPVFFTGVHWGWINIGLSLDKYYDNTEELVRNAILTVTVIFLILVLFSFLLAKKIVAPIVNLHSAIKEVHSGNFDISVDTNSNDEIGELSKSFISMVKEVQRSDKKLRLMNEDLEDRVKRRTEELNELNIKLDQKVKDEVQKRRKNEQILIQQSRFAAMGEMIGNIAHQWRQPLNALGILIQNLEVAYEMELIDEKYIHKTTTKSQKLVSSMSQTIDDFRNFFRHDKKIEEFNISNIIYSAVDILKSSLDGNQIELTLDIDESLNMVGYSRELSQSILNIIGNAKDALVENTNESRAITVALYEKENYINIDIKDNGGGIKDEIIDRIFDPYFTTKEEGKGTGIGLYMTKTIIESHMNGTLMVRNIDAGALFKIRFRVS